MRQGLIFFIFILVMSSVFATVGGDVIDIFYAENCVNDIKVQVNATLNIDEGEYWLLGCTQTAENQWICPCSTIQMETMVNAVNNYTFEIEYFYETEQTSSTGGGSRRTRYVYVIEEKNITKEIIKEVEVPMEEDDIHGDIEQGNNNTDGDMGSIGDLNPVDTNLGKDEGSQEREPLTEKEKIKISSFIAIGVLLIISIGAMVIVMKNREKTFWGEK